MANWKKVLVSGSAIDGTTLNVTGPVTMSTSFGSGGSNDVLTVDANGHVAKVAQSSIAGITTAVFRVTGSDATNNSFNAASDELIFTNTNSDITTNVVATDGDTTTLKLTIKDSLGLVSSSAQIATQISGAFALASQSFVSQISAATASINTNISDTLEIDFT